MRKLPKGLDFAGGTIVTLVLEDWQQLTGTFIGVFDKDKPYSGPKSEYYKPRLTIDVDVEDPLEFLVLQLTEPAGIVSLTSAAPLVSGLITTGVDLGITSTTFAAGTFVSINLDHVLFVSTGGITTSFSFSV
ncbi:hypothetical protein P22_3395 [Propionispora sp. 2/2-37]|uniref:hypothetical protein n=1 Tax=Propionispora sp. 2/2-37 TaxID=1677858 RepID=UPI0006BB8B2A|nr:hypothetical protein [Propionispora sp. 2/2-37]CUH97268.1 hypothetical protein P22_3395 [Propionispora sp. 2/2-37]